MIANAVEPNQKSLFSPERKRQALLTKVVKTFSQYAVQVSVDYTSSVRPKILVCTHEIGLIEYDMSELGEEMIENRVLRQLMKDIEGCIITKLSIDAVVRKWLLSR
jgi:hypothetical protein